MIADAKMLIEIRHKLTSNRWIIYFSIMTKTQIQLPDDLYRRVKRFSAEREWSLAETFRRGVEHLMEVYPDQPTISRDWKLPAPLDLGWNGHTAEDLHRMAMDDMEPRIR
jgi:hypothetical protein